MYCPKCGSQNTDGATQCAACNAPFSSKGGKTSALPFVLMFLLIAGVIGVFVIGILAAVAIPAFMKYQRRAKTSEATMNLRKLFDSSVAYFETEHADRNATVLPRQFPVSAGPTPQRKFCSGFNGQKFAPDSSDWQVPTWQALNFGVDEPHYYQYVYESAGTNTTAQFTARAHGDLNCDDVLSTFERVGSADRELQVRGGGGIYTFQELE